MNNKGFIATSLIYAFFLVFVAVVATVLATYAHNRILVDNVNSGIEGDLNESIEKKYVFLTNILVNSDFEETGGWTFTNASISDVSTYQGAKSVALQKGTSPEIRQVVDNKLDETNHNLLANHYYYFRYYIFRNGLLYTSGSNSSVTLQNKNNNRIVINFDLNFVTDALVANWDLNSNIKMISTTGKYDLIIKGNNINGEFYDLNLDSMMLVDVTDLIKAGSSVAEIKAYMDTVDYFIDTKSIPKP